jgi:septum formation protein
MILSARLILASRSPRRIALLRSLGLEPEVKPAEGVVEAQEGAPALCVMANAAAKAGAVRAALPRVGPEAWVLGADTVVVLDGEILGKPRSAAEAAAMLRALSGRAHDVYTGFHLVHSQSGQSGGQSVRSAVRFRTLADEEIVWYVASGEPLDKAGAYGAQGLGSIFIAQIEGSFSNVVGLPICELASTMIQLGALHLR